MASLVGAFAASHGPLIVREWENVPPEQKKRMSEGFRELGRRIVAAKVDVVIAVSPDHWSNFFLDNVPTICIGVGTKLRTSSRAARSISATLHACAMQPRGVCGASPSKISEI